MIVKKNTLILVSYFEEWEGEHLQGVFRAKEDIEVNFIKYQNYKQVHRFMEENKDKLEPVTYSCLSFGNKEVTMEEFEGEKN